MQSQGSAGPSLFRFNRVSMISGAVCLLGTSLTAIAGPDWLESGDAGPTVGTAQVTAGVGQLRTIAGQLSLGVGGGDLEDLYIVSVTDPANFRIDLLNANFDSVLYLFNLTQANEAFGLLANDNSGEGFSPVLTPVATDGTGAQVSSPGIYAIAVCGAGRRPVSINGNIFTFASAVEVSGPDGPGGLNPLSGWQGTGQVGSYVYELEGTGFAIVPAPGAVALSLAGGVIMLRRRR